MSLVAFLRGVERPRPSRRCRSIRARPRGYFDIQQHVLNEAPTSARQPSGNTLLRDPAEIFLARVTEVAREQEPEEGLEIIYPEIDALLRAGKFEECDHILVIAEKTRLPVVHALAFVSITSAARDKLPARSSFVATVRARLEHDEPTMVDELLAGIE